jgi:sulfide:quinone oxidoreductase
VALRRQVCGAAPQTDALTRGTLEAMPSPRRLHVVVAGGGPAAVETLLTLRRLAGPRVQLTLVAPQPDAIARVQPIPSTCSALHDRLTRSTRTLAREAGADYYRGRVVSVDAAHHTVTLQTGRELAYDALVLAVGARARVAYGRALTFFGRSPHVTRDRLLADIADGWSRDIAFVVPPGLTWSVPLYDLAIQTGTAVRRARQRARLRLITPERTPLALFGARGRAVAGTLLDDAGVAFVGATAVAEQIDGRLRAGGRGAVLPDGGVVALPVLAGPALPGTPTVDGGFLPVDAHGAVRGLPGVFAAGSATSFPLKQADLACQQAAAVAEVLAERAGTLLTPQPWRPVVRAHLHGADGAVPTVLER